MGNHKSRVGNYKAASFRVSILTILASMFFFGTTFIGRAQQQDSILEKEVTEIFIQNNENIDPRLVFVSDIDIEDDWAFGIVGARASETEAEPMMILFLAQKVNSLWNVEIETSSKFQEWMSDVPVSLVSQDIKFMFAPQMSAASNGANLLSLPWMDGETWKLTGGPHSNSGKASDVWSSLDFQGSNKTGTVVSARDGIVWRSSSCPNFVLITHPDGYKTGYYHLSNITVSNGQSVSRGYPLGEISTQAGCGGYATGPHVHFSLRDKNNTKIAINGVDIGGWTAQNGTAQYNGCMQRTEDGYRVCQGGMIYNSGVIGSGINTDPPPSGDVRIVNTPSLSKPYGGGMCDSGWYRYVGYGGNYAYLTLNTNQASKSGNTATWRPDLPKQGVYKVEAYIGVHGTMNWQCPSKYIAWDTSDARYTINYAGGSSIVSGNQAPYYNEWLDLGNFTFNTGTGGYVYLSDLNSEADLSKTVSFGAMRFTLISATDTAYPQVTDISLNSIYNPTAPTIKFEVTFTENVTGVDKSDFTVTAENVSGASVTSVSGSGKKYTVTVNTGTGNGKLRLNLIDNDSIKDSGNNRLGGIGTGNGNFSSGYFSTKDKPPVILVHGWQGLAYEGLKPKGYHCDEGIVLYDGTDPSMSTLGALPQWFLEAGYEVWIAHLESNPSETPSLKENAACLLNQIEYVASKNDNPITVVAHSMGGLVSRATLTLLPAGKVKELYTLGTPHAGIYISPTLLNCKKQVAACEMYFKSMKNNFNNTVNNLPDVTYNFIGGSYNWDYDLFSRGRILENLGAGPNDGLVGKYSAVGWVYNDSVFAPADWADFSYPGQYWTDEVHSETYSGGANNARHAYYEPRTGEPNNWSHAFQCVIKLMKGGRDNNVCKNALTEIQSSSQASLDATNMSFAVMSTVETGSVADYETVSIPIQVDTDGETLFTISWVLGNFELTLTRPDNQLIDTDYVANHPEEVKYEEWEGSPESAPSKTYYFENAMAGEWKLNIMATSAGDYSAYAMMTSPYFLKVVSNKDSYAMGDVATIIATIEKNGIGVSGQVVNATFTNQDGSEDIIALIDQGDGVYTNTYLIPNIPGYLQISVDASGNDQGTLFAHHSSLLVTVNPEDATYTGSYLETGNDTNLDGLYEALDFEVEVNTFKSGDYALSAELYAEGQLVSQASEFFTLASGVQTVTLPFVGRAIRDSGIDGPYNITNVVLAPLDMDLQTSFADDVLLTTSYNHADFGVCYALTLDHRGNGSDPIPTPANSTGCANGEYVEGENIQLDNALPDADWAILGWEGTENDASIQTSNSVIMPGQDHAVVVNYVEDTSTPIVENIVRFGENPISSDDIRFAVTFSKNVVGVDALDFEITVGGTIQSAVISSIEGSNDVYIVKVDAGFADGTVTLDLVDNDSIIDGAQRPLGGSGTGNGDFVSGEDYVIDNMPITVSITRRDANPIPASTVEFLVEFSEPVTDLDAGDFVLTTTGTVTGETIARISGSGDKYTVAVDIASGDGTIRLDVMDDDSVMDSTGNPLGGAGTGNGDYTGGASYTISSTAPPGNDDFYYAEGIKQLGYQDSRSTIYATVDGDDPFSEQCGFSEGAATVWYEYTPDADTAIALDTFGSGYDTFIAVWTGDRGDLDIIACNNDASGSQQSQLAIQVKKDTTYYIEIGQP